MKFPHLLGSALLAAATSLSYAAAPSNPWLADSPWPINHQSSYQQASSPYPGPVNALQLAEPQSVSTGFINISLAMSPLYPDSSRVYWGTNNSDVYKLAVRDGNLTKIAALAKPQASGGPLSSLATPASGAYTVVDFENTFYVVRDTTVLAYRDTIAGDANSPITLARSFTIPSSLVRSDDVIVGLNFLWDGNIAFATLKGKAGVIQRDFSRAQAVTLGAGDEEISNSIATDEKGGIYVVTSKAMYRVQWTGSRVSLDPSTGAWRATYNAGTDCSGDGNLGCGSGSTPTLMGTAGQKFVVITDGAKVANIVLFWRDGIPKDWQPIAPGKNRRIAAEVPVNFGNPNRESFQSEQSVLVNGYGAVVVSNDYRNYDLLPETTGIPLIDSFFNGIIVFFSGSTLHQPWGVQKFEWDTAKRKLRSAWVRNDVSCPNGIPAMSEPSNRFYCVGAHKGSWTLESMDWTSGLNHFRKYLGEDQRWNSYYSAIELTGDGGLIYGTTFGAAYLPRR